MTAFQARVEQVVTQFLETAVVVDDYRAERAGAKPKPVLNEPTMRSRGDLVAVEPSALPDSESHPLEDKTLVDAFAEAGIICSVIVPEKGEDVEARVLKTAGRADLLVLDWELHRDGGATARSLIDKVLKQDAGADRRRLRVIAIYTGQATLVSIMQRIRRHLKLKKDCETDGGLTLAQDGYRIVGFCKPIQNNLPAHIAARQVEEFDLPRRLTTEFSKLTDGLVPAVALAALAAIRNDAHRILQALNRDLDIAYLGHRVASPFPKDAEGHLVGLLAAEIASILDDHDVGAAADLDAISDWLGQASETDADGNPTELIYGSALTDAKQIEPAEISTMLSTGLGLDEQMEAQKRDGLSVKSLKKVRKQGAHLFTNDAAKARAAADSFGMRMAVRTVYTRPNRVLRLGTIVLRQSQFFLCLQPRCDSVRIPEGEERGFPFLPLTTAETEDAPYEFVVDDPRKPGTHLRLRLRTEPQHLASVQFVAAGSRSVEAVLKRSRWSFYDSKGRPYMWVAELKPEFAQRVAVELAGQISRVGLSESELIRLASGKA